jgi:hypothetical protein
MFGGRQASAPSCCRQGAGCSPVRFRQDWRARQAVLCHVKWQSSAFSEDLKLLISYNAQLFKHIKSILRNFTQKQWKIAVSESTPSYCSHNLQFAYLLLRMFGHIFVPINLTIFCRYLVFVWVVRVALYDYVGSVCGISRILRGL